MRLFYGLFLFLVVSIMPSIVKGEALSNGSRCTNSPECKSGSCVKGYCKGTAAFGEVCEGWNDCAGLLQCDPKSKECNFATNGNSCETNSDCLSGNCLSKTCKGSEGLDEPCKSWADCAPGFTCDYTAKKCGWDSKYTGKCMWYPLDSDKFSPDPKGTCSFGGTLTSQYNFILGSPGAGYSYSDCRSLCNSLVAACPNLTLINPQVPTYTGVGPPCDNAVIQTNPTQNSRGNCSFPIIKGKEGTPSISVTLSSGYPPAASDVYTSDTCGSTCTSLVQFCLPNNQEPTPVKPTLATHREYCYWNSVTGSYTCSDFANNDGGNIFRCHTGSDPWTYHSITWYNIEGGRCLAEPQSTGQPWSGTCCFQGEAADTNPEFTACYKKMCGEQTYGGWVFLDPGVKVTTGNDVCIGKTGEDCMQCCQSNATKIEKWCSEHPDSYECRDIKGFKYDCYAKQCGTTQSGCSGPDNGVKDGVCLPSCGKAGGSLCAQSTSECKQPENSSSPVVTFPSYDCKVCCLAKPTATPSVVPVPSSAPILSLPPVPSTSQLPPP